MLVTIVAPKLPGYASYISHGIVNYAHPEYAIYTAIIFVLGMIFISQSLMYINSNTDDSHSKRYKGNIYLQTNC
jgi:hypothetical protein